MTLVKNYSYLLCVFGFVSLLAFIIFCIPVTKLIVKGMKYDNDVEKLHEEIDAIKDAFKDVNTEMADKILKLMEAHRKDSKKMENTLEGMKTASENLKELRVYLDSPEFIEDILTNLECMSNDSEDTSSNSEGNAEDNDDSEVSE